MSDQLSANFCGRVCQANWSIPVQTHPRLHEMIVVLGGEIRVHIQGQYFTGREGDVLFYHRGHAHQEQSVGRVPLETVYWGWHGGDGLLDIPYSQWPVMTKDRMGRLRQLTRWGLELSPARNDRERLMLQSLLHACLFEFMHSLPTTETPLTRQIRPFVQGHLGSPMTLADLAARAGLSKFYFLRSFVKETGQTPMAFVRGCRLQAAKTLVLTTTLPLKAIARQTGFCDEYSLNRAFRDHFGLPPGQARRSGLSQPFEDEPTTRPGKPRTSRRRRR